MTERQVAPLDVGKQQPQAGVIVQQQGALQHFIDLGEQGKRAARQGVQQQQQQQQQLEQPGLVAADLQLGGQLLQAPPSLPLQSPSLPFLPLALGDLPPLPPVSDASASMQRPVPLLQQQQQQQQQYGSGLSFAQPLLPPFSASSTANFGEGGISFSGITAGLDLFGTYRAMGSGTEAPSILTSQCTIETPISLSAPVPPPQAMFEPQQVNPTATPRPAAADNTRPSLSPTMMVGQAVGEGTAEEGQGNTAEAARHFEAAIKLIFGNKATQEVSTQLSSWLTAVAAGMASPQSFASGGLSGQDVTNTPPASMAAAAAAPHERPPPKLFRPDVTHAVAMQPVTSSSMVGPQGASLLPGTSSVDSLWNWYTHSNTPRLVPMPVSLPTAHALQQPGPPSFSPLMMQPSSLPSSIPCAAPSGLFTSLPMPQQHVQQMNREDGESRDMGRPTVCQICNRPYDALHIKKYVRCRRICNSCRTARTVTKNGLAMRFCQLCSWVHPLSHFDEGRKSCRRELKKHNERRRKRLDHKKDGVGGQSTETGPFLAQESNAIASSSTNSPPSTPLLATGPPLGMTAIASGPVASAPPTLNGAP